MDSRRTDVKVPLHFVFCRRNTMHVRVLNNERQIFYLPPGELAFLLPPALLWAKDIHHSPVIKNNDVLLGWVTAGFKRPLTLSFALLQ
jgi:hypothetical protein